MQKEVYSDGRFRKVVLQQRLLQDGADVLDHYPEHRKGCSVRSGQEECNKDSAVFNYTDEVEFSSDWTEGVVNFPGVTTVNCHTHCTLKEGQTEINHEGGNTKSCDVAKHENFEYAATAILLNFGKAPANAELYIDDITVYDGEGNVLSVEDFENATIAEYDNSKTVYYPAWQGKATFEIVEMTTTGINDVKVAAANAEFVNAAGQKVGKNYKGLVLPPSTENITE